MTDPTLEGCWARLERAEEQLGALEPLLIRFIEEEHPHEILPEQETDSEGWQFARFVKVKAAPLVWGVRVGEVVHDLRSALDNLVWQLVLLNDEQPGRSNEFPVARTEQMWKKATSGGGRRDSLAGISDPHRQVIESLQPYKRGHDATRHPIWVLADVNNTDKHRTLHPGQATIPRVSLPSLIKIDPPMNVDLDIDYRPGDVEEGAVIFAIRAHIPVGAPAPHVKMSGEMPVRIVFGDRRLRLADFYRMGSAVADVLDRFEVDF